MAITTTSELQRIAVRPSLTARYFQIEGLAVSLLAKHGFTLLRLSIALCYIWFGALKLVPGASPIEGFIFEAMGFLPLAFLYPLLAVWEIAVGVGFLTNKFPRVTIFLMLMQMGGAMSPLILRPDLIFTTFPAYTLVGQYIVKDFILVAAALVLFVGVRGGLTDGEKAR
ncbi:MAG: hypothetical protein SF029_19070 [bacterium]|nr:hypothetical protein [bacterium]